MFMLKPSQVPITNELRRDILKDDMVGTVNTLRLTQTISLMECKLPKPSVVISSTKEVIISSKASRFYGRA